MAIVQRGNWGGPGGSDYRFEHVPQTLECTVENGQLTGITFVAGSNQEEIGNWPRQPTNTTVNLANESITAISGYSGNEQSYENATLVRGLTLTTTGGTHSVGEQSGTPFSFTLPAGSTLAGFAGKSGWRVDSVGVLVKQQHVELAVSLDTNQAQPVSVDAVGKIELMKNDTLQWTISGSSPQTFTFDQIKFYRDQAETDVVGAWSVAEGVQTDPDFLYTFTTTSTSTIEITDDESPANNVPYWYKLWVKDASGNLHVLDPEIINFTQRN